MRRDELDASVEVDIAVQDLSPWMGGPLLSPDGGLSAELFEIPDWTHLESLEDTYAGIPHVKCISAFSGSSTWDESVTIPRQSQMSLELDRLEIRALT